MKGDNSIYQITKEKTRKDFVKTAGRKERDPFCQTGEEASCILEDYI